MLSWMCVGERLTYHQWCAPPTNRALVIRSPYPLLKYVFLDLLLDVICSVARFRLRVHTLCYETATWNHMSFTTCDRCEANHDIQPEDEQHVFQCTHPQVALFVENLLLYLLSLRWKVGFPPPLPVGSGFEPYWRLTTG